jgi:hypothetical protein
MCGSGVLPPTTKSSTAAETVVDSLALRPTLTSYGTACPTGARGQVEPSRRNRRTDTRAARVGSAGDFRRTRRVVRSEVEKGRDSWTRPTILSGSPLRLLSPRGMAIELEASDWCEVAARPCLNEGWAARPAACRFAVSPSSSGARRTRLRSVRCLAAARPAPLPSMA